MTLRRGCHLHVDCASGAAGDMMLGAMIDLGVPVDAIEAALIAIGAGGRLRIARVMKRGIAAVDLKVDTTGGLDGLGGGHAHGAHASEHAHPHSHATDRDFGRSTGPAQRNNLIGHSHGHDHAMSVVPHTHDHAHDHHHYGSIRARIVDAVLTPGTKQRALDIFDRLARAEAKLHGSTVEDVQFHEVGAIDSIVDVVGTAAALDWLSPASVSCVSVAMGHGTLTCAHGVMPVPAPAALEVMREAGGVMADGGLARELCTPTGAAILAATVTRWAPAPTGRALGVGWGAGDLDLADRANALRLIAMAVGPGEHASAAAVGGQDVVWQVDANLDDMSPELCAPALDAIFAAGAVDAWWAPITMKKGRPALALSALVPEAARTAVVAAILRETTTIGVRFAPRERTVLARELVVVETRYGAIPVKVARDHGAVRNAAPEYEACLAAARLHDIPVKLVFAAALAAFDPNR